jgi:hypothetical protein
MNSENAVQRESEAPLAYELADEVELAALREKHAWIVEPIYKASSAVLRMPFFDWLRSIRSPLEFGGAAKQLYYHSATFPKVMGIMLGLTSMKENAMMPFYAKHALGESDHHMLLREWMLRHQIIKGADDLDHVVCTIETNACVNYAYQMALEQDRDGWLVGLNSGIERCSNDFFKVASPVMRGLGAGHFYFDTHVEADEHHSIMGLAHIQPREPSSRDGVRLINKALEGISLWAAMLHSWIGLDVSPRFSLDGALVSRRASVG